MDGGWEDRIKEEVLLTTKNKYNQIHKGSIVESYKSL